jgi:hypothetical protein
LSFIVTPLCELIGGKKSLLTPGAIGQPGDAEEQLMITQGLSRDGRSGARLAGDRKRDAVSRKRTGEPIWSVFDEIVEAAEGKKNASGLKA